MKRVYKKNPMATGSAAYVGAIKSDKKITKKQVEFIGNLVAQGRAGALVTANGINANQASSLIDAILNGDKYFDGEPNRASFNMKFVNYIGVGFYYALCEVK